MSPVFDKTRCLRCGVCVADCVCGILSFGEDGFPALRAGTKNRCVQCGHCVAVCPAGATVLNGRDPFLCPPLAEASRLEENLDFLLKGRRAIRQYTDEVVPRHFLEKAFEYAAYAPTAHNYREVAYTVINGRDRVKRLLNSLVQHMEKHGFCPAHTKNVHQGQDTLFRGAPCLILIHAPERALSEADCATAAAYLELSLHGMGLGSCWAGMMVEACAQGLPEKLFLPEGHKLYAALMVGMPKVRYKRLPFRSSPIVTWQEDSLP